MTCSGRLSSGPTIVSTRIEAKATDLPVPEGATMATWGFSTPSA